eukprot:COSAG06_NODE_2030_length_7782_cov_5.203429_5_plen_284_part_00
MLAEIGVLGRGATDHGRMDAEVGQPATASDPPGPVAPAPLVDGRKITAAMIKAAVKHEKPVVLSADRVDPNIRGRNCSLVRVVLEAVYRRQGWPDLKKDSPKAFGALSKALKAGGLEGFEAVAAVLESLDDDALWPFRDEAWRRQQGHVYGAPPPVHNYAHTVHSILHHILRCCPAMASGSAAVATVRAGLRADYAAVLTDADLAVMVGLASKYSPAPATAATPCDLPVLSLRIFEHNPQNGPERLMFKHLVELACAALEKSALHGVSLERCARAWRPGLRSS